MNARHRTAPVNKIIDSSFVDGTGNRTVVFFQGCNYNCVYCHNPETINLCRNCGLCVSKCPAEALVQVAGHTKWKRTMCTGCDLCITACPFNASPKVTYMTVSEIMARIKRNASFIRGVTCSGGECTLYKGFLTDLFLQVRALGLITLADSNGTIDFSKEHALMSVTSGVILDIKAVSLTAHTALTGEDNNIALKNLVFLAEHNKLSEVRVVVSEEPYFHSVGTVREVSSLLAPYTERSDFVLRIIPFSPIGVRKEHRDIHPPSDFTLLLIRDVLQTYGIKRYRIN